LGHLSLGWASMAPQVAADPDTYVNVNVPVNVHDMDFEAIDP